jgi:hypothetical protein
MSALSLAPSPQDDAAAPLTAAAGGSTAAAARMRTLQMWLWPWLLLQVGAVAVDWSTTDAIDPDPRWLHAGRRQWFYLAWAIAGVVSTVSMLAWAWRKPLLRALVWALYGPVTLVWVFDYACVLLWRGWWSHIEHQVSSTMHTEANDALRAIVLRNQVATALLALLTSALLLVVQALAGFAQAPPKQSFRGDLASRTRHTKGAGRM